MNNPTISHPGETEGEYGALQFIVQSVLSRVNTATLVKVVAVSAGWVGAAGTVDVQPLVNQIDGSGNGRTMGVLHNLPYLRVQGGANAIILDPEVGDIGIAVFCSRDISKVKTTKKISNPGSWAIHSMSDGLYLGGVLNGSPSQYVSFGTAGVTIHSPIKITLDAPAIEIHGTVSDNGTNIGATHVHGGVQPGSGSTSTPY